MCKDDTRIAPVGEYGVAQAHADTDGRIPMGSKEYGVPQTLGNPIKSHSPILLLVFISAYHNE